ncbi:hypothetical protein [Luteolibacter marinus]|uniref:hypothetical protein n=1 Tax=Luteolibacter marinus TaxID=2776705 RepID=UPI00186828DA|nr:hypothetical protein [Luteolibacter marinus]
MRRHLTLPFALLLATLSAAEPSRQWTDTKGRTMTGTLVDKSETHAEVLLKNGKRANIKLADLSQADREYVAAADVMPEPDMEARTVKLDSNEANTKYDARCVEVTLSKMRERPHSLTIHWLGPKGNTVAVYASETKEVNDDGTVQFKITYKGSKRGVGPDYKGFVVGLLEDGETGPRWVQKSASQKPFERFLDEVDED